MSTPRPLLLLAIVALVGAGHGAAGGERAQPSAGTAAGAAEVPSEALAAFESYADRVAVQARAEEAPFLRVDRLGGRDRDGARARGLRGEPWVERIRPRDSAGREIDPRNAMIHHWVGAVFVPGASLEQALATALAFDRHDEVFAPEVVVSELRENGGERFSVFLRFQKRKVITLTYDTLHDVRLHRRSPERAFTHAVAVEIHEIEDAGEPDETAKPTQEGRLHGIHTWWRYEATEGGVWVENESLTLTDDVGFPASLVVGPLLRAGPREGVESALLSLRRALLEPAAR